MAIAGALLVVACALWALRPQHQTVVPMPKLESKAKTVTEPASREHPIDPKVFAANLWNPPPPPVVATKPQPPEAPKPLNLQLIGIINEDGRLKAALYDMDGDRMLIVGDGDKVNQHVVKSVTEKSVELTDGRSVQRLTLSGERS